MTKSEQKAWDKAYEAASFIRRATRVTDEQEYLSAMDKGRTAAVEAAKACEAAMAEKMAAGCVTHAATQGSCATEKAEDDKHGRV